MRSTWRWSVQSEVGVFPRANGEAKVNGSREPEVTAKRMRLDKRLFSFLQGCSSAEKLLQLQLLPWVGTANAIGWRVQF
jgi:hypothetical protein